VPTPNSRQITDSATLAALAHPLRRRLIDLLRVYGPATASALATRTDQAVANISHHLRVLSTGGLIEPAPELARDKRERWWRLVSTSLRWSTKDFGDAAGQVIADTVQQLGLEQHISAARTWFATDRADTQAFIGHAFTADKWLHLTPEELYELSQQVGDLFRTWAERTVPDDGRARVPVLVFAYGMPATP
jgi:DNA-binding transcriptional ArsR family regulator